jgi:hypothetical protein
MAIRRKNINILKDVNAPVDNILGKYNYGNGAGWCVKRDKKRAKRSASKVGSRRR